MNHDIRSERRNRGWTLAAAAQRIGITVSALSMIERGLRRPTPKVAFDIATTYGLKVTDIWPEPEPAEEAA